LKGRKRQGRGRKRIPSKGRTGKSKKGEKDQRTESFKLEVPYSNKHTLSRSAEKGVERKKEKLNGTHWGVTNSEMKGMGNNQKKKEKKLNAFFEPDKESPKKKNPKRERLSWRQKRRRGSFFP